MSGDKNVHLFVVQGGHLYHRTFYGLLLGRKGEVKEPFLNLLFLKHLHQHAKVLCFELAYSEPLH